MIYLESKPKKTTRKPKAQEPEEEYVMEGHGHYLRENGVMFITKSFSKETIMPVVIQIMEYNLMPEEIQPEHLTLIINSPGGTLDSAFHLIDMMKSSSIPIHTIGFGSVASAALMTLMAGEKGKRQVTHNTSIMSHQYTGGTTGKEHELIGAFKNFEMVSDRVLEHYMKCTGLKEKIILDSLLSPTDMYMTPEEALEYNLIDTIWETY